MSVIVVGLDLSPSAGAALQWAAEEARAHGQTLRAVHAVDISPDFNTALGISGVAVPMDPSAMGAPYREEVPYRDAIAAAFDSVQPGLGWRLEFFSGEAGPVLVAQSTGAALLVVGTKEHVGIGRLVSGSVSHYCLSHAQCPVVAVPAPDDRGATKNHNQASADAAAPA